MTKQDWDYHITEVGPNFDYDNLELEPEEKFQVEKDTKTPIVIIFGWAGCIDKYLRVYARLYEERGLNTIRYIVPGKYLFFQPHKMVKIGEEMARAFSKQKFKDSPAIIHLLSNGGGFQYEVFMRGLNTISSQCKVKGAIFDSCPTKRRPASMYEAIKANVDSKYFKVPISLYLTANRVLKRSLEVYYARLVNREYVQMDPYNNLMNEKGRWPQLFIYSSRDKIIPTKYVEMFANHRKALGVDVTLDCYSNSQHVQHYLKNKASYIRSVVKFVNKCLKK